MSFKQRIALVSLQACLTALTRLEMVFGPEEVRDCRAERLELRGDSSYISLALPRESRLQTTMPLNYDESLGLRSAVFSVVTKGVTLSGVE